MTFEEGTQWFHLMELELVKMIMYVATGASRLNGSIGLGFA